MAALGWLTRSLADVPADEGWLGPQERHRLAALSVAMRRADWRLGRWTAKAAVGAWVGVAPEHVEILAASDGAPEAWVEGVRAPVSVSLSHRAGRALAAVADAPSVVGCDLERVEPRSSAFIREWLAPAEQDLVDSRPDGERARLVNLLWSAKEAAAKVKREGLRLDVRHAVAAPTEPGGSAGTWSALRIDWPMPGGGGPMAGWWRAEPEWIMTIAAVPTPDIPQSIRWES
jgi:4'-phosphopantetheinyl transferase